MSAARYVVEDSCPCGAEFATEGAIQGYLESHHRSWLLAHAECKAAWAANRRALTVVELPEVRLSDVLVEVGSGRCVNPAHVSMIRRDEESGGTLVWLVGDDEPFLTAATFVDVLDALNGEDRT